MAIELRQSTAGQEVPLGYFLDSTDGDTEETGLTIANTDIKIWKFGATVLANKNSGGGTHISNGIYYAVLDATDTDTLGALVLYIHVAGALTIVQECAVLPANVWDAKYSTDKLQVDMVQSGGSAVAAGAIPNAVAGANGGLPTVDASNLVAGIQGTKNLLDDLTDADATAANQATLLARLTAARAGYLDNLNIAENVAGTSEVTSIQNNTRVVRAVQTAMERPDSGSTAYVLHIYCYDSEGNMEAPDAAPTIAVENQAGTSRNANLDSTTMTLVAAGHYKSTYTVASDHAIEQLLFQFSIIEGGATRVYGNTTQIVDTTAVDFTAADRTKLEAVAADWADAGRLDAILDIIAVDVAGLDGAAMRGTDSASTHDAAAVVTALWASTGWDSTATMTFGDACEIVWAGVAGNIAKSGDVYVHKGPDDTTTVITLTLTATSRTRS